MKTLTLMMVASITCLITAPASASIVIDQEQTIGTAAIALFFNGELAQSFQPAEETMIGASLKLAADSEVTLNGDITISLFDAIDSSRTLLGSGTQLNAFQDEFVTVTFDTAPVSVTPGNTYFLVYSSTNESLGIAGTGPHSGINDPYARGQAFIDGVAVNVTGGSFDFRFNTQAVTIPEPSSLAVCGFSVAFLLAAGAFKRRKREHISADV